MSVSTQKPQAVLKILEDLDGIKQWRKEQFQLFQEKQKFPKPWEKSAMVRSGDSQPMSQHKGYLDATELQSIENSNTTVDSSVTGHILRCFNDSTENSPAVSKTNIEKSVKKPNHEASKAIDPNCDLPCVPSKKPVRPFLRKKSGLNRYYKPKSSKQVKTTDNNSSEQQETLFVRSSQNRNAEQCLSNFMSSQRNTKEPSHRNYVHFKEQESTTWNKNTHSDINEPERFGECHTNVDDQINLNRIERDKIPSNFKKPDHAISNIGDNLNPDVQHVNKVKEQSSFPLKSASEIPGRDAENAEFNHVVDSNTGCDDLNQSQESLAEFETLEKRVQESSFNSDSSLVQRVVKGERLVSNKPDNAGLQQQHSDTSPFKSLFNNINVSKFRGLALARRKLSESKGNIKEQMESGDAARKQVENNEVQEKKKENINAIISDNIRRIDNLQKEVTSKHEDILDNENFDNERCSTPVNVPPELSYPLCANVNVDNKHGENQQDLKLKTKEATDLLRDSFQLVEKEDALCDKHNSDNLQQNEIKEIMKQKIVQLENEIAIYKEYNAQLEKRCKERDEVSRKLNKEYNDIEKYKTEQMKKVDEEVEKARQQMKRERESFQRLKKSQKENFSRKEREELSALRKENEELQEELRRQKIKFTKENRRLNSQLVAAENEREESKLKVITLEEQVDELLKSLRASRYRFKTPKSNKSDQYEESRQKDDDSSTADSFNSNEKKDTTKRKASSLKTSHSNKSVKVNSSKPKVHFDLPPELDTSKNDVASEESKDDRSSSELDHDPKNDVNFTKSTNKDAESHGSPLSEVSNSKIQPDIVQKLLPSGDTEIIYPSGTKKTIRVDGTIYIVYHNGQTKYIYPDKHEIHQFENGVVEESFPDGSRVTKFPNGQVQYLMPDGIKENNFPDGDSQIIYPDGTEVIKSADGMQRMLKPDGTDILYWENGEREIRTSTYKKREFADGSVRILYINGRRETRYTNGRIRVKDKDGRILFDTKYFARQQAW
ncbi:centromere protein J isoform X2 [Parasteatoda tepidariorum]|uniref:centromere protein J isoform X2 n=1 Tax=Parasteatoda tepidariorum TaxID=114398 RepID=UPI001C71AEFA|nr:centromere protein J isoform X2 [Parasteatoda tepidariorum]